MAALLLVPTYLMPLWKLTMFAPQYPDGLRLEIYSYKLEGGNGGQDVKEINILNHYIGMRDLTTADFTEFKWMPFVVGMLGLLFLRALVSRENRRSDRRRRALPVLRPLLALVLRLQALLVRPQPRSDGVGQGSARSCLRSSATRSSPTSRSTRIPPPASYALAAVGVVLLAALVLAWREARLEEHEDARTAG